MLFLTFMTFFLLNTLEYILKNVGNQTVSGSHWLSYFGENTTEVNGCQQLFGKLKKETPFGWTIFLPNSHNQFLDLPLFTIMTFITLIQYLGVLNCHKIVQDINKYSCDLNAVRPLVDRSLLSYGVWLIIPNKTPFQRANYEWLHGAVWSRIWLDEMCSCVFWHQPSAECYVLNYTDPARLLRMASLCLWHIICDNSGDLRFTLNPG